MNWSFQADRPIYLQLKEQIKHSIISDLYPPGSKMPTVRDIALEANVNPNTVQKSLSELEREGLLYTQRTSGRYVTEDKAMIEGEKNALALKLVDEFLEEMKAIGFAVPEVIKLLGEGMGVSE